MAAEVWDRFTVHYTPTYGSWLNQAEIEIGIFSRQCLGKRRLPVLKILRKEARACNRRMNRGAVKIAWKFDRKTARRNWVTNEYLSSGQRPSGFRVPMAEWIRDYQKEWFRLDIIAGLTGLPRFSAKNLHHFTWIRNRYPRRRQPCPLKKGKTEGWWTWIRATTGRPLAEASEHPMKKAAEFKGNDKTAKQDKGKQDDVKQEEAKPGKLTTKQYTKALRKLQGRLCELQEWVKHKGLRVIIVFEGRDAAGKGGTIKALTERVSPRVFRVVALPAPSDREKSQMYMQRYMPALPGRGRGRDLRPQLVQPRRRRVRHGLLHQRAAPPVPRDSARKSEKYIDRRRASSSSRSGWRSATRSRSAGSRPGSTDPLRQWKLSPMDLPSRSQWFEYSRARDMMLEGHRHRRHAPWYILRSDDKKRARLNCIRHILELIPYKKVPREKVKLPKRSMKGAYDDQATLKGRKFIPEEF